MKHSLKVLETLFALCAEANSHRVVTTPHACPNCLLKTEEFNDGGYCYMWKDNPPERCASFQPLTPYDPIAIMSSYQFRDLVRDDPTGVAVANALPKIRLALGAKGEE